MSLKVRELEVQYRGGPPVLHGVDVAFAAGALTLLIGPNASGKSSLLQAMAGLLPYRGRVELNGQDLQTLGRRTIVQALAYVPQRTELDAALRVGEVVGMGRAFVVESMARRRAAVQDALQDAGVSLEPDRRFPELSGGQRQGVLLARALATQAKVLLLDEPSAALDLQHTLRLYAQLKRLANAGYTVIWALHDLQLAARSGERCVLLHEGRVVAQGPSSEVVCPPCMKAVYGVQMQSRAGPAFGLDGESGPWC